MKASTPGVEQRGYAAGETRLRTVMMLTLYVIRTKTAGALRSQI